MLKKDLAEALGISAPMVSKLAQRGMPVHSIDAARKWRASNLSQGHTKTFRAPSVPRTLDPVAVAEAANCSLHDVHMTPAWHERAPLVDELREAMQAIPPHRRHELHLFLCCWDALMGRLPTLVERGGEEWVVDDAPWFEIAAGLLPMPAWAMASDTEEA